MWYFIAFVPSNELNSRICALKVIISSLYVNNMHANMHLVNSDNWSQY